MAICHAVWEAPHAMGMTDLTKGVTEVSVKQYIKQSVAAWGGGGLFVMESIYRTTFFMKRSDTVDE